ncbi:MAG: enoyl-CoA hydratase-related protein [Acidimicrobiales bacterium]
MDLKVTQYDEQERVAVITLNRPERRNSWTGRMQTELFWLLDRADNDSAVGAIVVTGAGESFCVGADFRALESHTARGGYSSGTDTDIAKPGYGVHKDFDADFASFFGISKPIIAAINGAAAGIGFVLACYCDLRIAVPGAKLTSAHGRLNLPAEFGLSWLLPRVVGLGRANDMLLSSRIVAAEEALQWGLVNEIHEPAELLSRAVAWGNQLTREVSPGSLSATKMQVYADLHQGAADAVHDAAVLLDRMIQEPDFAEGLRAFLEKRPPAWNGTRMQ